MSKCRALLCFRCIFCRILLYCNQGVRNMKKRTGMKVTIVLLCLLVLALAGGFVWLQMNQKHQEQPMELKREALDRQLSEIEAEFEEISVDEDSGMIFVNDEIILMVPMGTPYADVEKLAEDYDAQIVDAMEDLGIYQLKLEKAEDLDDLEDLIEDLEKEDLVESAYINPVSLIDEDAADPDPAYPDDPWNGADWDTDVPRDENWSAEAVRAPQAWAYLDELTAVRVGLIDGMVDMEHEDLDVHGAYFSLYDQDQKTWTTQEVDNSDLAGDYHGTHVAGIMTALWNDDGVSGMMGDKGNVYYSAAFNGSNGSYTFHYATAYTYVKAISVLLEQDVQAINISQNTSRLIGFAASHGNKNAKDYLQSQADLAEEMLKRIIQQRKTDGRPDFVVCVAAGNSNSTTYYVDSGATYGFSETQTKGAEGISGGSLAKYNNFLNLMDDADVAGRIIVVGALGIDYGNSTADETRYAYAYFSNVGDRVDIGAPGVDVYSTYTPSPSYDFLGGTSMACPHVTAAAGMAFAANPELTGPEVKSIVRASQYGTYYFEDGACGMLDLSTVVSSALATRDEPVNRVIGTGGDGLDVCFLVDTTGSMNDDIENAKDNMVQILDALGDQTSDYRVALVDYRDFDHRSGDSSDYPAKIQLNFTDDPDEITTAIDDLTLGHGGDTKETVYSGFALALTLDWRSGATKAIIVLGDAPPLDPEPETGYTYESVVQALYNAEISIDPDWSDERVLGDADDSLIQIYTIGTSASSDAIDFFSEISEATGGQFTDVEDASGVSDAIVDSIEQIEVEPRQTATAAFGKEFSGETVEFYYDGEYQFSVTLNSVGLYDLENMRLGEYDWRITRLQRRGSMEISQGDDQAQITVKKGNVLHGLYALWHRHRTEAFVYLEATLLMMILVLILSVKLLGVWDRRKYRAQMLYCENCGAKLQKQDAFCPNCGRARQ